MKQVRDAVRVPPKVHMARLAEDYDGIGQYVLVSLSEGSVSSAYMARVAAGDFGGGRRIPAGTRVPVINHRGKIEVLLGNQPRVIQCAENFKRSVVGGWGNAEFPSLDGWRYTNGVPGDDWYRPGNPEYFSVSGGLGIIDTNAPTAEVGNDPASWFFPKGDPETFQFPAEFLIKFFPEVPADFSNKGMQVDFYLGDSHGVGSIGSVGDTIFWTLYHTNFPSSVTGFYVDYFGSWQADTFIELESAALNDLWNNWLLVRFRVEPTGVMAKIWKETDPEPNDWMVSFNFPDGLTGWAGLRNVLIYGYKTTSSPPFTVHPTKYKFDYIKDIYGRICAMSGADEVPVFNGAINEDYGSWRDDFTRSVTRSIVEGFGPWGTNPQNGIEWRIWNLGESSLIDLGGAGVDGSAAYLAVDNDNTSSWIDASLEGVGPSLADHWVLECRFRYRDTLGLSQGSPKGELGFVIAPINFWIYTQIQMNYETGLAEVDLAESGFDRLSISPLVPDAFYRLKWDHDVPGGFGKIKLWKDGDPEPDWMLTSAVGDYRSSTTNEDMFWFEIWWTLANPDSAAYLKLEIDWISMDHVYVP